MNKSFDQICDAVEAHKDVESCFIQHIRAKDYFANTKGKSGLPDRLLKKRTEYRVFIRTAMDVDPDNKMRGKVNYNAEGPDLLECVREAFSKCSLTLPPTL
jgi:hypothetical protein